jgi:hypothetical protein
MGVILIVYYSLKWFINRAKFENITLTKKLCNFNILRKAKKYYNLQPATDVFGAQNIAISKMYFRPGKKQSIELPSTSTWTFL